jgi:hypothetical protein
MSKGTNWAELVPLLSLLIAGIGTGANAYARYAIEEKKLNLQREFLSFTREQQKTAPPASQYPPFPPYTHQYVPPPPGYFNYQHPPENHFDRKEKKEN